MDDGETQPRPVGEPAAKGLKHAVEILGCDANAFVRHADLHLSPLVARQGRRQGETAPLRHRPQAIGCQVPDDLPDLPFVGLESDGTGRHVDNNPVALPPFGAVLQERGGVGEDGPHVHVTHPLPLRTRVLQEAADGVVQPLRLANHDVHQLPLLRGERQLVAENLDRPRHRGERVADLMGNAGGHLTDGSQPLLHARRPVQPARLGHVLEGQDESRLAPRGHQRDRADPHLDCLPIRPCVQVLHPRLTGAVFDRTEQRVQ